MPKFHLDTGSPENHARFDALPAIAQGYIRAALFCAVTYDTGGDCVEIEGAGLDQLAPGTLESMAADACRFWIENTESIRRAEQAGHDLDSVGADFWFTRNRHGVGFWDRGLADLGDTLTRAAEASGECDLFAEPAPGADLESIDSGKAEAFTLSLAFPVDPLTQAERAALDRLQGAAGSVPPLATVGGRYGAPVGRAGDDLAGQRAALVPVPLDPGGYDAGGAYWGHGAPLWRAVALDGGGQAFARAETRQDAARIMETEHEGVTLT